MAQQQFSGTSRPNSPAKNTVNTSNNPVGANRSSGSGLPKEPAHPPHKLEQVSAGEPANHYAGNKR